MTYLGERTHAGKARSLGVLAALSATLMLGACAQLGEGVGSDLLSGISPTDTAAQSQDPAAAAEYWSKKYAENPANLDVAIGHAKGLKARGEKTQALAVLEQASMLHPMDKTLASEYGRLALELDQVTLAKRLLEVADNPAKPDWRVVMARGTALAKEGRYKEAEGFFERALALQPDHPSVLSNLALAYTMSGNPEKGEALLRRAAERPDVSPKVRQNLALVLGLQGKYDEATKVGSVDLPAGKAQENSELIRKMVKADPKASGVPQLPADAWDTQTVELTNAQGVKAVSSEPVVRAVSVPAEGKPQLALRPSSH